MSLRMQDLGEVAYGGAVTLADWWDQKRIVAGTLTEKAILKKAGFYTYLVIGLAAAVVNIAGWWRRGDMWTERLMHGFFYGLPGFIYVTAKNLQGTAVTHGRSDAVAQAQEILRQRRANEAARTRGGATNYEVQNEQELLV